MWRIEVSTAIDKKTRWLNEGRAFERADDMQEAEGTELGEGLDLGVRSQLIPVYDEKVEKIRCAFWMFM